VREVKIFRAKHRSQRPEAVPSGAGNVVESFGLTPTEAKLARLCVDARVQTIGTVKVHVRVGLQALLSVELRELKKLLGERKQEKLATLAALAEVREQLPSLRVEPNLLVVCSNALPLTCGRRRRASGPTAD